MKTFCGYFGIYLTCFPGFSAVLNSRNNKVQFKAVRILEGQHARAETLDHARVPGARLKQPMRPIAERGLRDAERRLMRLAAAQPSRCGVRPGEEGQDGAGTTGLAVSAASSCRICTLSGKTAIPA